MLINKVDSTALFWADFRGINIKGVTEGWLVAV